MSVISLFIKLIIPIFFEKNILESRYFTTRKRGYWWALRAILYRNILRLGEVYRVPVGPNVFISNLDNVVFDLNDLNNLQSPGLYLNCPYQKIFIGTGSFLGPNVGIITSNHSRNDLTNLDVGAEVHIGKNCWIGMNAVILPGVKIADNVIVGAGAVVTKSIAIPGTVVAGNPARNIDKSILNQNEEST